MHTHVYSSTIPENWQHPSPKLAHFFLALLWFLFGFLSTTPIQWAHPPLLPVKLLSSKAGFTTSLLGTHCVGFTPAEDFFWHSSPYQLWFWKHALESLPTLGLYRMWWWFGGSKGVHSNRLAARIGDSSQVTWKHISQISILQIECVLETWNQHIRLQNHLARCPCTDIHP